MLVVTARDGHSGTRLAVVTASEDSIADLVERARSGRRDAFETLYRRFVGAVHAVVLAHARAADTGDIVQEVFMSGWSHLGELREPEAFAGWILGIARRRAIDARRKDRRRGGAPAELSDSVNPAAPVPASEAKEALSAIQAMSETYRETLLMRLVEGMTGPEIAEVTGMTPESVRVNLCRGMKLLRDKLDGSRGEP